MLFFLFRPCLVVGKQKKEKCAGIMFNFREFWYSTLVLKHWGFTWASYIFIFQFHRNKQSEDEKNAHEARMSELKKLNFRPLSRQTNNPYRQAIFLLHCEDPKEILISPFAHPKRIYSWYNIIKKSVSLTSLFKQVIIHTKL